MPLTHPILNTTAFITLILLFTVSVSFFVYSNRVAGINIFSSIFTPASVRKFNNTAPNVNLVSLILALFALFGYGFLILQVVPIDKTWTSFWICTGILFVFFAVKYLIVALFFNTMFPGIERNFISRYHQLTVLSGLIAFVSCIILGFAIDCTGTTATIVAVINWILYCVGISYIFLTTFSTNNFSILRLFLYLCTLEFMPTLTLVKALTLLT